jgi:GTP diphosphokinase / guanosine-3',5'-bis(diphosphate) 3'-diphosphatase
LTKIAKLDLVTKEAAQAENLRKLLLAMSKDVRVLLVKLADRLHNMRTLQHVKPEKSVRIAQETMDIYAPLAGRMGMQAVRDELEDIAFKVLNPEANRIINERLAKLHAESGGMLTSIEQELTQKLAENGIKSEVSGREKRPYSIFRKMERKLLSLGQLSDIFGFRVLVGTVDQCYRALGIIHRTYRAVPGRFKDYISTPKQNDYRSIHTTVIGPHHMRVEMQIRTRLMHEIAERGVAAHAMYKDAPDAKEALDGFRAPAAESNAYRWLRHLVEMLQEGESPREFLEHTKLELFHDQVFCFTPKGKLIALPRGATPIDFAYAVHTSVGDSCVGAKINGSHAPLVTELKNGDEVDIIRSDAQTPPAAWEGLAVTGKARAAIRRATRAAARKQFAGLGREIVEKMLAKIDRPFIEKEVAAAIPRLGHKVVEDALAAVGRGELSAVDVLTAMGLTIDATKLKELRRKSAARKNDGGEENSIPVRGVTRTTALMISPDTGAVPGERIVGIIMPGAGIMIYPIFARALEQFDNQPERWVDLAWDTGAEDQRFPARITVSILNEVGSLAQVTQVISDLGGNIDALQMVAREGARDFFDLDITVEVHDLKHLNEIMAALRSRSAVSVVTRKTG